MAALHPVHLGMVTVCCAKAPAVAPVAAIPQPGLIPCRWTPAPLPLSMELEPLEEPPLLPDPVLLPAEASTSPLDDAPLDAPPDDAPPEPLLVPELALLEPVVDPELAPDPPAAPVLLAPLLKPVEAFEPAGGVLSLLQATTTRTAAQENARTRIRTFICNPRVETMLRPREDSSLGGTPVAAREVI
jgi:hypothetical protein